MTKTKLLGRLIFADLKRLKNYIVSIIVATLIIATICGIAGSLISKNIYKSGTKEIIGIGYYLPDDGKEAMNNMGISMLEDMESMKSTATLIQTSTIEEGYELLEQKKILYFIIVPEKFISSIMNGTNTPLEIIVWDNSSITSYIANEMFMSYAKYLGLAQSSVYSVIDVAYSNNLTDDERKSLRTTVNLTFLDRSLNKDTFFQVVDVSKQGQASLLQHYLASAVMLTLIFMSFVLMPHLQGYNQALRVKLDTFNMGSHHILISNLISCVAGLYISFIPCFVGISIVNKSFNPLGLIKIIPSLIIIGFIIALVAVLTRSIFAANMTMLIVGVAIAYIGGGIIPRAMLPSIIQELSQLMPGRLLIENISAALYGF